MALSHPLTDPQWKLCYRHVWSRTQDSFSPRSQSRPIISPRRRSSLALLTLPDSTLQKLYYKQEHRVADYPTHGWMVIPGPEYSCIIKPLRYRFKIKNQDKNQGYHPCQIPYLLEQGCPSQRSKPPSPSPILEHLFKGFFPEEKGKP